MKENSSRTIMILSAPIGSGHVRAAEALKEQLDKRHDVHVVMGDIFDFVPGFFCKSLLKTYLFLLRNLPSGYECLYRWGDTESSLFLRSLVNKLFSYKGSDILKQVQPDAVLVTHVTPAGIISLYKKETGSNLPLFGVVTDYSMHKWWLYDEINSYFVFDREVFSDYFAFLHKGQKLCELGIPVHEEFRPATLEKKQLLRKQYNLPQDAFICLLSGGGEGLLPMQEILRAWQKHARAEAKIYFIAICGKNQGLYSKLAAMQLPNLQVLSYTEHIADYMKMADLLVSKAGGVTVTEAISVNLPVLVYKPLPGQEYVNTKYLLSQELVCKANNIKELSQMIAQASDDKNFFGQILQRQKELTKPKAAEEIIKKIFSILD